MNPPHCDLVLSGICIRASPNLDIFGVKFDSKLVFEDHMCPRKLAYLPLLKQVIKQADAGIGYLTWTNKLLY